MATIAADGDEDDGLYGEDDFGFGFDEGDSDEGDFDEGGEFGDDGTFYSAVKRLAALPEKERCAVLSSAAC